MLKKYRCWAMWHLSHSCCQWSLCNCLPWCAALKVISWKPDLVKNRHRFCVLCYCGPEVPRAWGLNPPWVVSGPHRKTFILDPGMGYTKLLVICLWCSNRSSTSALYASPIREKTTVYQWWRKGEGRMKKERRGYLSSPAWHPYM